MVSVQARVDAYKTLAFGSVTSSYVSVGSVVGHKYRILHLLNNTNQDIQISFDGTTNNIYMPAGSFDLYDLQAAANTNSEFNVSIGTQIYAKAPGTLPSTGAIFIMGIYGSGE